MAAPQTPGVYIQEISVFPPSVAEVATAIPAFIGYTQQAIQNLPGDLNLVPTKIYSLKDFEQLYGLPYADTVSLTLTSDGAGGYTATISAEPTVETTSYLLYHAVRMFFDNGGAQCYICSVGTYVSSPTIDVTKLTAGLTAVGLEDEPTLLVIPEAAKLGYADYSTLVQAELGQAATLGDRFAILDAFGGDKAPGTTVTTNPSTTPPTTTEVITANRNAFVAAANASDPLPPPVPLGYGAAYYPYVQTTFNPYVNTGETNVMVTVGGNTAATLTSLSSSNTAAYNAAKAELKNHFLVVPPSGAIAGVYAATDAARGVWKAPANVALVDVLAPVVKLTNLQQDGLNVDSNTGKSINALRAFTGKGTLVWGARTLAGNDNEWRYVSVRRFFTMVEQSVKSSTSWAVFEPNDANTWVKVRGMIANYLVDKWRDGALAGAKSDDAFFVKVALGTTMSSQDILEGRMIVQIGMAAVRPAEFIILQFTHLLQTS